MNAFDRSFARSSNILRNRSNARRALYTCTRRYRRLEDALDARFPTDRSRSPLSIDFSPPAPPPSVHASAYSLSFSLCLSLFFSCLLAGSISISISPLLGVYSDAFRWIEKQARCPMRVDIHPAGLIASTADRSGPT